MQRRTVIHASQDFKQKKQGYVGCQTTLKSVIQGKFALFAHFLSKLDILTWIGVIGVKMSYCDVIFDDVTKTLCTNFQSSKHQIYHLKEHDQGTIILKTVPRYDKYFSSYSNLKKFQFPPRNHTVFLNSTPLFFVFFNFL